MLQNHNLEKARAKKLSSLLHRGEEHEIKRAAIRLGLTYADLRKSFIQHDSLNLVTEEESRRANLIIIKKDGNSLSIGVVDPENDETKQLLVRLKAQGFKTVIFLISGSSFAKAVKEYKKVPAPSRKKETTGQISVDGESGALGVKSLKDLTAKLSNLKTEDASDLLELLLVGALKLNASDIHIEPEENTVKIRVRVDGLLRIVGDISQGKYRLLLSRIKLLSNVNLNVTDKPQDGRFTIKMPTFEAEVRTSILPGAFGEYVVLRVLNPKSLKLEVKDLGLRESIWQQIKKEIEKPNGIVLVTGPTGSGKTTTLYAFVKYRLSPEVKIMTLEDPIEYHLSGVSQSRIEPEKGFTFAEGIRSALRQDPDIILVGEIRDEETAQTTLNAALTGHLVLSTLHTNDAPGAIPRFLDLNAKPKIVSSALNSIVAQRLVRRLCKNCKKPAEISDDVFKTIKDGLAGDNKLAGSLVKKNIKLFKAQGCAECSETGYKGRIGIFEVLPIDENVERVITLSPSHAEVLKAAQESGFLSMYHDGLLRVIEGITTIEEIAKVSRSLK